MTDWSTLGVAAIAVTGPLAAVGLKARFDRRQAVRRRQEEAYERLIAAGEILAIRLAGKKEQATYTRNFARTIVGMGRFLMLIFLVAMPRSRNTLKLDGVVSVVEMLPFPTVQPDNVTDASLWEAFEEMQRAWVSVQVLGTDQAIEAGEALLSSSSGVIQASLKAEWMPGREALGWRTFQEKRDDMTEARERFRDVARKDQRRHR